MSACGSCSGAKQGRHEPVKFCPEQRMWQCAACRGEGVLPVSTAVDSVSTTTVPEKLTVALQYPARTDTNGITWYRPLRAKGVDFDQWGWTSDPAQADPSYAETAALCTLGRPGTPMAAEDRAAILEFRQQLGMQTNLTGSPSDTDRAAGRDTGTSQPEHAAALQQTGEPA